MSEDDVTTGGAKITVCADDLEDAAQSVGLALALVTGVGLDVAAVPLKAGLVSTSVVSPGTTASITADLARLTIIPIGVPPTCLPVPGMLPLCTTNLMLLQGTLTAAAGVYRSAEVAAVVISDIATAVRAGGGLAITTASLMSPARLGQPIDLPAEYSHVLPDLTETAVIGLHLVTMGPWAYVPGSFQHAVSFAVTPMQRLGFMTDSKPISIVGSRSDSRPAPPDTIGDLARDNKSIEQLEHSDHTTVRIHHVVAPDGTAGWIVNIPGTANWDPRAPHNPSDSTGDLLSMGAWQDPKIYGVIDAALASAMARAGVKPGSQPVMLAGHSEGGIFATRLAQKDWFRQKYDVRQVVTFGSPVTDKNPPDSVMTFDVEHKNDLVPRTDRLESLGNKRNRVTLRVDPTPQPGDEHSPIAVHDAGRYAETADRDASRTSTDRNVKKFYEDNDIFLRQDARDDVYEYDMRRE